MFQKTSDTSNLLAIGSCKFRIARAHKDNSIFCRKNDLCYETGVQAGN